MKRFFTKHSLNIFSLSLEKWDFPLHRHNFYELIFIEKGSGVHTVNEICLSYKKGDIFMLTPRDAHSFEIEQPTVFAFIKFTKQLLIEKTEGTAKGKWRKKIDAVLCNPNTSPESVVVNEEQKRTLFSLKDLLQMEYENKDHFSRHIVLDLFGALITSISRSVSEKKTFLPLKHNDDSDTVNKILAYIRQHIYEKEALTLDHLADKFQYSPNYIGIYIKKHTGLSLRQIILETKVKTAERLLKSSTLSVKEIAARLCFNDTSHFTKTFKKIKGSTPTVFKL